MILKKLKLKNFRGYKDFEVSFCDSINVIIGRCKFRTHSHTCTEI